MTKHQFRAQRLNAQDRKDFETYLSECGGSMPEEYYADGADIVQTMQQIWDLAHDFTFRRLHDIHGGSLLAMSQEYGIPLRSLENWNAGNRLPPEYVLEFLAADILSIKQ
jgi:hypothetical protein